MDTRDGSAASGRDEWSVTLNGRYVVRFCGAHAQEYARQQLRELAELLGFDEPARGRAETTEAAERSTISLPVAPGNQR
jgi:hypothetical protein